MTILYSEAIMITPGWYIALIVILFFASILIALVGAAFFEDTSGKITKVKMQLFYCEYSDDDIRWSYELNFSFPYEINLEEKTFKKLQLLSY